MIANLTEQLKSVHSQSDRSRIVIGGKRDLMQLLVDKTLEYHRVVDQNAEVVLQELVTQYEHLIDQILSLKNDEKADSVSGSSKKKLLGSQDGGH